ncbi:hypothetical protein A9P91_09310 [Klebsiella quasipneumoniae subsp. similipneumoniae]|nr:hypothetical protein AKK42_04885 [Klebsiella quasipneumoniae]OAZ89264.1 hypothetical protein A9G50_07070 [Klebsiella quasipneumoniae subsp. similipneumoniae]OON35468.1 hypothetical protein BU230_33765 [Klebsiella pneumoniae]AMR17817.1 hypothetical protein AVR78_25575 [Klebsiella quasipneumoniae]ASR23993.1 hypothetical protein AWV58_15345 [Klebsiella quasipneumoniae]
MSWKTGKCYRKIKCPLEEIFLRTGIFNIRLTSYIPFFMME